MLHAQQRMLNELCRQNERLDKERERTDKLIEKISNQQRITMKRFLGILGLILFSLSSAVAQPARFVIDEKDPFTGEHIRQTNSYWGVKSIDGTNTRIEYYINITDNESKLFVRLCRVNNFQSDDSNGYSLLFVDSKNNIVSLNGDNDAKIDNERVVHSSYGISTSSSKIVDIILSFPINKRSVENTITSDIQHIRIEIGGVKFDYTLKNSDRKNIANLLKFVTPYL